MLYVVYQQNDPSRVILLVNAFLREREGEMTSICRLLKKSLTLYKYIDERSTFMDCFYLHNNHFECDELLSFHYAILHNKCMFANYCKHAGFFCRIYNILQDYPVHPYCLDVDKHINSFGSAKICVTFVIGLFLQWHD